MTKQQYISLQKANRSLDILYEYYKQVSKKTLVDKIDFQAHLTSLCYQYGKDSNDLFITICKLIEGELKVWRVYTKDGKFINYE